MASGTSYDSLSCQLCLRIDLSLCMGCMATRKSVCYGRVLQAQGLLYFCHLMGQHRLHESIVTLVMHIPANCPYDLALCAFKASLHDSGLGKLYAWHLERCMWS